MTGSVDAWRMATFGVLTGGGDCPGLNAVIRAVVRRGQLDGHEFVGFHGGWLGVRNDQGFSLTHENTAGLVTRGGTILGTSRTDPLADGEAGMAALRGTLERRGIDGLVVIGGNGTLAAARDLSHAGLPLVAVPKTIDNDVPGTDFSVGFHTAVQIASDAIDRLHTTAESHNRVMVVEVMGRHAGWIATYAGIASGADMILVPEQPFDIDAVCEHLRRRHDGSHNFSIVVVAEGASGIREPQVTNPQERHACSTRPAEGVAISLGQQIEQMTGYETRVTILGHVLRGGTPVAFDRILATRFGVAATEALLGGRFGQMMALRGPDVLEVGLEEALAMSKPLDPCLHDVAAVFFE
jgi:6-phosphofructokinase 1